MKEEIKNKLRIQNCITAIMDVYDSVLDEFENIESFSKLEQLEREIRDMDMAHISEADIRVVEQTTNALLVEFKPFFETEGTHHIMLVGEN